MSLKRWNPKRDANEKQIVDVLQATGAHVYRLSGAKGLPDLLCCYRGVWTPLEVKSEKGKLTRAQVASMRLSPFIIVRNETEALQAIGAQTR